MNPYGPYKATVVRIHDGDTMTLDVDLGFGLSLGLNIRIYGINAPELSTPEGKDALAYAQTLLRPGDQVMTSSYGWDKYGGRFDGELWLADGRDFGMLMIEAGRAVPLIIKGDRPVA